jgi:demethylmenaquinone methyltransferase / 2-methoxy-6-polyprenyl-1,4-benzoquinol methylase
MTKKYYKDSPESIQKLFGSIAKRYDRANSLMSFHLHALWNKKLVRELVKKSTPSTLLDLCAGTGEITKRLYDHSVKKKLKPPHIDLVDFSQEMLEVATTRCETLQGGSFAYHVQNAEELLFENNRFCAVSMAYGIRNVQNTEKCIKEVHRVLKKDGWFGIVELTRPENRLLRGLHKLYLHTALPVIGRCFCANKEAYSYLSSSIGHFISPYNIKTILEKSGFDSVQITPLQWGIATLILARKS